MNIAFFMLFALVSENNKILVSVMVLREIQEYTYNKVDQILSAEERSDFHHILKTHFELGLLDNYHLYTTTTVTERHLDHVIFLEG